MPRLMVIFLASLLAAAAVAAADAAPEIEKNGAQLYARFCSSCHGLRGLGDGPAAPALKVQPADLTRISARQAGEFPAERVREMIDGRAVLPAHGTREMPVWGYELEARAPAQAPARAAAQAMTDSLVEHLRSIQH